MSCEEIFLQQLRERGFRFTPQREMVLKVMHQIDGHATAEAIYARVQRLSSSVDISTVYRTLELLQEFDLVIAMDLDDDQRHYELLGVHGAHCHLLCRSCRALIGVSSDDILPLIEHVQNRYGFQVDVNHLVLPGLCQECRGTVIDKEVDHKPPPA